MNSRWIFVVVGIAAVLTGIHASRAQADSGRALWVWNSTSIRTDPAEQSRFFGFLAAPRGVSENKIDTLFFDSNGSEKSGDSGSVAGLRRFLKEAHARKIRVYFLCGDPHWALASNEDDGLAYVREILAFNAGGAPDERYDGIQFDVEPYTLPDWPSPQIQNGLLDLLDKSHAIIQQSGQPLRLTAVIPRWYDQAQFNYIDHSVIDRVDAVAIMDYVNSGSRLVDDAKAEMDYASKVGKKAWIGVETNPLPDTPKVTFYDSGNAGMEEALTQAAPAFAQESSFGGYAIHDWKAYQTLKP